jgi:hypothetical protein
MSRNWIFPVPGFLLWSHKGIEHTDDQGCGCKNLCRQALFSLTLLSRFGTAAPMLTGAIITRTSKSRSVTGG